MLVEMNLPLQVDLLSLADMRSALAEVERISRVEGLGSGSGSV